MVRLLFSREKIISAVLAEWQRNQRLHVRGFCEGVFVSHLDNVCVIALIWKHSYFEKVHKINLGTLPNKRGEKIIDENRKEMENFVKEEKVIGYAGRETSKPTRKLWARSSCLSIVANENTVNADKASSLGDYFSRGIACA